MNTNFGLILGIRLMHSPPVCRHRHTHICAFHSLHIQPVQYEWPCVPLSLSNIFIINSWISHRQNCVTNLRASTAKSKKKCEMNGTAISFIKHRKKKYGIGWERRMLSICPTSTCGPLNVTHDNTPASIDHRHGRHCNNSSLEPNRNTINSISKLFVLDVLAKDHWNDLLHVADSLEFLEQCTIHFAFPTATKIREETNRIRRSRVSVYKFTFYGVRNTSISHSPMP